MHRHYGCKKSTEEIAESLNGCYKEDQLHLLKINHDAYKFIQGQIDEVDGYIESCLRTFPAKEVQAAKEPEAKKNDGHKCIGKKRSRKNGIKTTINLEERLIEMTGVNLMSITGLGSNTILQVISEVGTDMSKFPSAKHFAAYLGFVPRNKITGGVIISSSTDRTKSRAAQAFKKIIPSISRSDSAFAAFYHRISAKAGTGKAITATCRKLAMAFYNTIVLGQDYVEEGNKRYKQRLADKEKSLLEKLARKHNMQLSPVAC